MEKEKRKDSDLPECPTARYPSSQQLATPVLKVGLGACFKKSQTYETGASEKESGLFKCRSSEKIVD